MKKIILVTFLILAFHFSFSQSGTLSKHGKRELKRGKSLSETPINGALLNLSSNTSVPVSTRLYKAGDEQKLDEETEEVWDSANAKWVNGTKTQYKYDNDLNVISELYFSWDASASLWVSDIKLEHTRTKGNITTSVFALWDKVYKKFVNASQNEYTYDIKNNKVSDLYNEWDNDNLMWLKITKNDYSYDANSNLLTDAYSEWNKGKNAYIKFDKIDYTYDLKGNTLTDSYSLWDDTKGKYVFADKYENTFDASGNMTGSMYSVYDEPTAKWINDSKNVYTYDGNKNILTDIYSTWDETRKVYVNSKKVENVYDAKSNQTVSTSFVWDIRGNKWVYDTKSELNYDTQMGGDKLKLPYDKETIVLFFKTKLLQTTDQAWNKQSASWKNSKRVTYSYSPTTTTGFVNGSQKVKWVVFPNPAASYVSIRLDCNYSGAQLEIMDVTGKSILNSPLDNSNTIQIDELMKGVYFIQVMHDQKVIATKKLMVD